MKLLPVELLFMASYFTLITSDAIGQKNIEGTPEKNSPACRFLPHGNYENPQGVPQAE